MNEVQSVQAGSSPGRWAFLQAGGQMAERIRAHDWSATPLGPLEAWPPPLKTVVSLMLHARQPVYITWGPEQTSLYNDSCIPILGGRHPSGLGKPASDLWAESWDTLGPLHAAVLAGEVPWREDTPLAWTGRGRDRRRLDFSCSPLLDEADSIAGIYGLVTDATDKVLAEHAANAGLQERAKELQLLIDTLPVLISYIDVDERFQFNNKIYEEWFAQSRATLRGKLVREVIGEEAYAVVRPHIQTALAGEQVTFERLMSYAGVGLRHIQVNYVPRRDVTGQVAGFYALIQDISERKAVEARLSESEARFRNMADHTPVMIWTTDPSGYCTYLNHSWYAFTGQTAEEAEGFGWLDATHPDDRARAEEIFHDANAAREPFRIEYRLRCNDGSYRWAIDAAAPRYDANGGFLGYIGSVLDIHERREQETRLALSEEALRLATEAAEIGIWDLDIVTGELVWTDRVKAAFGLSPETACGMADFDAGLHPEDHDATMAALASALDPAQRATYDVEYRTIGKEDGLVRWVAAKGRGLFDGGGRCIRAVGTAIDITRRKRFEERLRASEARLKLAQQAAGIGVWDWDLMTGSIAWSPEMYDILGLDPVRDAADPYRAWLSVLHPEDLEAADRVARQCATAGEAFTIDFRILHGPAGFRWVRSNGMAVLDAAGRPSRIVGVNVDVTEEHRREAELRSLAGELQHAVEETRRERDRIYELSDDLFAVAGFDGYLKNINPAWVRLLGYAQAELLAQPFTEFIHPDDRIAAGEVFAALQAGRSLQRFEDRLIRADGSVVWIAWAVVPEGGRFYAVGRDVTTDKQREEALRQAQKMEAVGQLTGGIAHDFNNLLQAVHGSLDLIRRKPHDSERVARWAGNGLQAAERGAKLTAQLLAFSRAQKLELRPVAVVPLVTGMEDMLRRTLGPMVRITVAPGPDEVAAMADPTQLEMAVLNLAINARDAMPDGGDLTIALALHRIAHDPELPPGDYAEITVSDTGTGMSADVAARAFDPFFTTKGVGKGTGLGLSQVYGMARQAGGTVRLDTRLEQGTRVQLLLRVAQGQAVQREDSVAGTALSRHAPRTVLVVDDDPDVRRFLTDSLDALGYTVIEAQDGMAGLAMLERSAPDLLLVDFAMPGMTGAEVANAARARRPGLPIVFASGHSDTAAIDAAVGPSAVMLRKPFRIAELETVLANLLPHL